MTKPNVGFMATKLGPFADDNVLFSKARLVAITLHVFMPLHALTKFLEWSPLHQVVAATWDGQWSQKSGLGGGAPRSYLFLMAFCYY